MAHHNKKRKEEQENPGGVRRKGRGVKAKLFTPTPPQKKGPLHRKKGPLNGKKGPLNGGRMQRNEETRVD